MAEPTEADRSRAAHIVANWTVNFSPDQPNALENMISTYLADERERARAPFLAMCDVIEQQVIPTMDWSTRAPLAGAMDAFTQAIRRAVEETGQ